MKKRELKLFEVIEIDRGYWDKVYKGSGVNHAEVAKNLPLKSRRINAPDMKPGGHYYQVSHQEYGGKTVTYEIC